MYDPQPALLSSRSCHLCPGGRTVRQWEAHDKRIWAVDFCPLDATTYATGSDDGTVKVSVEQLQIAHSTSCMSAFCTVCGRAWIALSLLQL
jgi:WD40 repeat protein